MTVLPESKEAFSRHTSAEPAVMAAENKNKTKKQQQKIYSNKKNERVTRIAAISLILCIV